MLSHWYCDSRYLYWLSALPSIIDTSPELFLELVETLCFLLLP